MFPVHVVFHGLEVSESIVADVQARAAKLARRCPRASGMSVTLEAPPHHRHDHRGYRVRLGLSLRGKALVVGGHERGDEDDDAYSAVVRAFAAMERLIADEHARRDHGSSRRRVSIRGAR